MVKERAAEVAREVVEKHFVQALVGPIQEALLATMDLIEGYEQPLPQLALTSFSLDCDSLDLYGRICLNRRKYPIYNLHVPQFALKVRMIRKNATGRRNYEVCE